MATRDRSTELSRGGMNPQVRKSGLQCSLNTYRPVWYGGCLACSRLTDARVRGDVGENAISIVTMSALRKGWIGYCRKSHLPSWRYATFTSKRKGQTLANSVCS